MSGPAKTGRLFVVVGPSGAGKDTLLAGVLALDPTLHVARRVITRPHTPGAEPFEGVTQADFAARRLAGDFALHWQAHGLHYGLPHSELAPLALNRDVLFNGSRAALPAARLAFPDLISIRITAPSQVLAQRLAARGRESHADIAARLQRASYDLPAELVADLPVIDIVNDATPEIGIRRLLAALHPISG